MLRKGIALAAVLSVALVAVPAQAADTYDIDAVHSSVEFKVRHLVSKTSVTVRSTFTIVQQAPLWCL